MKYRDSNTVSDPGTWCGQPQLFAVTRLLFCFSSRQTEVLKRCSGKQISSVFFIRRGRDGDIAKHSQVKQETDNVTIILLVNKPPKLSLKEKLFANNYPNRLLWIFILLPGSCLLEIAFIYCKDHLNKTGVRMLVGSGQHVDGGLGSDWSRLWWRVNQYFVFPVAPWCERLKKNHAKVIVMYYIQDQIFGQWEYFTYTFGKGKNSCESPAKRWCSSLRWI